MMPLCSPATAVRVGRGGEQGMGQSIRWGIYCRCARNYRDSFLEDKYVRRGSIGGEPAATPLASISAESSFSQEYACNCSLIVRALLLALSCWQQLRKVKPTK